MEFDVTVQAYILVQTEIGTSVNVVRTIMEMPGVISAEDVTGPYDVIVRAEAETMDALGRDVLTSIQQVSGITRTLTCPVVHL
ncbi:MAG: Lrp/AsnC ligand binding domain-containing protein [Candidatus Nanopelagicales bacterium]|jgi:DNA-binding Lrp family transcriptional regulator